LYSHRAVYLHTFTLLAGPNFGFSSSDVLCPVVPMFHALGWGLSFVALTFGFDLCMTDKYLKPNFLLEIFRDQKITIGLGVPTLWQGCKVLMEQKPEDWASLKGHLKKLTVGGSAVPLDLIKFWDAWGCEIIQAWGMTETGPVGSCSRHINFLADLTLKTKEERLLGQAVQGLCMPGLEWKIVEPEDFNKEVAHDGKKIGELIVRGPHVTQSYFRAPHYTHKFHNEWLKTGDLGIIGTDECLRLQDRSKDLIKSGGEWISSIDMENMVVGLEGITMAAAVGVPHPQWVERPIIVAIKAPTCENPPTLEQVRKHLAQKFAKFQLPDDVLYWDALPLGGTGKIQKRNIREKLKAEGYILPKLRKDPLNSSEN